MFDEEYKKVASTGDIFIILYACGSSDVNIFPSLSAIVDLDCWSSYFGPFVGRTFMIMQMNHSMQLMLNLY